MAKKRLIVGAVAGVGVLALALTGCAGGSSEGSGTGTPVKGGTVTWLDVQGQLEGTDPATIYLGEQLSTFRRTVYRGLTTLPATSDANPSPIGDLATDAGTTPDGGKTWSYTLKDGLMWQDGSDITCADLQYGLSRSYDETLVNGTGVGITYLAQYGLYDPSAPDFSLADEYTGPLTGTPEAQAHFNNAASCDGNTITYHFQSAWPDFAYAAAMLFTTDPYQASFETGTSGLWKINSNGPYKFDGTFDVNGVNEFVRNDKYDAATDSIESRGAYPDKVRFEFVADQDTITQRLIADSGDDVTAVTPGNIPSSLYSDTASIDRTLKTTSPYTRFLQINSLRLTNPDVRRAVSVAIDKNGVIQVLGGENYGTPSTTIVSSGVAGYTENPSFAGDNPDGDAAAAKALLAGAGAANQPLVFAFADTPTNQKVAAVLQQSWEAAGFAVTLKPIALSATPGYYGQMSQRDKDVDVFWSGWAADWPSLFGVIPPILQSNPADADSGVGFNYGFFSNAEVDALIADATAATDTATQVSKLQEADKVAGADGAYAPILNQNNYFIFGSKIGGFLPTVASSFYPDLGATYVAK